MNKDDFKQLLKEEIDPIKGQLNHLTVQVEVILNRLDDPETGLGRINHRLNGVDKQFRRIIARLDDPETGLGRINERLDSHSVSLLTIESEIKIYSDMYKINQLNIERLDDRLITAEEELNITPPEDLKVPHFSN